jgi:hypothetical protein
MAKLLIIYWLIRQSSPRKGWPKARVQIRGINSRRSGEVHPLSFPLGFFGRRRNILEFGSGSHAANEAVDRKAFAPGENALEWGEARHAEAFVKVGNGAAQWA